MVEADREFVHLTHLLLPIIAVTATNTVAAANTMATTGIDNERMIILMFVRLARDWSNPKSDTMMLTALVVEVGKIRDTFVSDSVCRVDLVVDVALIESDRSSVVVDTVSGSARNI